MAGDNGTGTAGCCPKGSHGELPESLVSHEPLGVEKRTSKGMDFYEVGEGNNVIVVFTDVFGWKTGRHRLVCDLLAEKGGFHVFMPDYFHGTPAAILPEGPFQIFARLPEFVRTVMQAPRMIYNIWSKFYAKTVVEEDIIKDMLPTIREIVGDNGNTKLACLGFCFGGWVAGKACAYGEFHCGVSCHPSFSVELLFGGSEESVARSVSRSCPLLLMPASNDSSKLKPNGSCMNILGENSESIPFPKMIHGWVTRGDSNDPEIKAAQEEALDLTQKFITNSFSRL